MPQLMPMYWVFSVIMSGFVVLSMVIMYYDWMIYQFMSEKLVLEGSMEYKW